MSGVYKNLHGTKIAINDVAGPFRPCRDCGHTLAMVDATPIGKHAGSLECCGCGAFTSFLGRDHMAVLLAHKNGEAA